MYYTVTIHSKDNSPCIITKELNRIGLKNKFIDHFLVKNDVINLQKKAKKHLKNSYLDFRPQITRSEYLANLKKMYPGYNFKQLKEIGFNI